MEDVDYSLLPAEVFEKLFPEDSYSNESAMYVGKCK